MIGKISFEIEYIKLLFMVICIYYIFLKITNNKILKYKVIVPVALVVVSCIEFYIRYKINYSISVIVLVFILSFFNAKTTKNDIGYSIINTSLSFTIYYIFTFITLFICYLINKIYLIKNDFINLIIIIFIQLFFVYRLIKVKKIKNGISYINKIPKNDILNISIMNISVIMSFSFIIFTQISNLSISRNLFIPFALFAYIMYSIIKKSIEAYYKQKLLIQDLNETKKELNEKRNEIKELEAENLKISKKAHSLAHKQKSLEFKINKIIMNSESAEEIGLRDELKNISNELIENSKLPSLNKTGISEIDDMFNVMQEECRLNGIDFVLQLKGNIYQMTNHYITKEELSILLADHIKDAIIAINHSDNINKSIMVRLGKIEECFAVYFYDSGVEFPKEVLDNLGKKPITTYSDEGGTGMGFMNTFDLLNKYNASLIIEKIGSPCKDNYTKIIKIKFDDKKELII